MPGKKLKLDGVWFIAFASILWAFDGVARTDLRASLPAINIVFYEHFFALIVLLPIIFWKRKEIFNLTLRDWSVFAGIGFFAGVLATLFYTAALGQVAFIPFSIIYLMQKLQPFWAISSAKLVLKEKLPKNFLYWAALALFASYLITFKDLSVNFSTGDKTLLAGILALFTSLFWGLGTTFGRFQLKTVSFWTTTSIRFLFGTIFSFILMFALAAFYTPLSTFLAFPLGNQTVDFNLTSNQFSAFLVIVFFLGLGPMLIYYFGLRHVEAKVSTIVELISPAMALIIDLFYNIQTHEFGFRNNVFSITQIVGILLIFICIFQVSKFNKESDLKFEAVNEVLA